MIQQLYFILFFPTVEMMKPRTHREALLNCLLIQVGECRSQDASIHAQSSILLMVCIITSSLQAFHSFLLHEMI